MILSSPSSVAFQFMGFSIYWYGIIIAFAILVGAFVADFFYRKYFKVELDIMDIIPTLLLVGVCGARIYYCILNWEYYAARPLDILNVREGGLSIHGMFIFCAIFLLIYCKIKKVSFFNLAAPMCLGISLAQSIGRWGNFFNSEAYGKPFDGFLKLYISPDMRPLGLENFHYFHPTFLYESVLDFCIFLLLILTIVKLKKSPLFITSFYFALYSCVRIFVESFRIDSVVYICGLPIATVVSVVILFFAAFGIVLDLKYKFR